MFKWIFILFFFTWSQLEAQLSLQISINRFGTTKIYEIHNYEVLTYKLKGDFGYRKNKIIHMQDSLIIFENETEIKLKQLKAIRFKNPNHLVSVFQPVFFGAGIMFMGLNTINNLIVSTSPVISERAAYISAGLIATSLVIRELGIKRIRITRNKQLKVLDVNYQNLSNQK